MKPFRPDDEADPNATEFLQPNYIYLDTRVPRQNRLLIFFQGPMETLSAPKSFPKSERPKACT